MPIILIILLIVLFGGGGGYYAHSSWGAPGSISVGTILLIVLVFILLRGGR